MYSDNNVYYDRNKEVNEAIAAGEQALYALREADRKLESAGNWGIVDMIGGKGIAGIFKHARISGARNCINDAQTALRKFSNELRDVREIESLSVDIGDFLTFADFFFDGLFADFIVQNRIREAQGKIRQAIGQVEDMLRRLRGWT